MGNINYINGDAMNPQGLGNKIICHICNDINRWGSGFVLAISKKWLSPEADYHSMKKHVLGDVRLVKVENDVWIANMIGQHLTGKDENGNPPIRYNAVKQALTKVNEMALNMGATLHMPRIGCGLAGGKWDSIEAIIKEVVSVDVTVYDF